MAPFDPSTATAFNLDIQGSSAGMFTVYVGLAEDSVRTGAGDVRLVRGVLQDMTVWEWRDMVERGEMDAARKLVRIQTLDTGSVVRAAWELEHAWPIRVSGPELSSDQTIGCEELTLSHEGHRRVS